MAVPVSTLVYPADEDTGVPVGATILLYFDVGVDLESVKKSIVLYGADYDLTSGPDIAMWIDKDTGNNPYFLRSPGFKGLVPLEFELVYVDLTSQTETDPGTITSQADEASANVGSLVRATPKDGPLAGDLEYTLYVTGDPDSQDVGVSSRTVFDVEPDAGNAADTGSLVVFGTWEGSADDTVVVEITTDGNIGTADYSWYYSSLGAGSAVEGRITNRRFRRLEDGLQIRFTGSGFVTGDTYTFNVSPVGRMAASFKVVFTTNDGSYTEAPDSPSTPAESEVPAFILPGSDSEVLEVTGMTPENGAYNVKVSNRTITIEFSDDLDATTIDDDSVKLWKYPVDGSYGETYEPVQLQKTMSVSGNVLTITF